MHLDDLIIIANYAEYSKEESLNYKAKLIFVDENNNQTNNVE